jgi:hypothetical protein
VKAAALTVVASLAVASCGLQDSRFVDYKAPSADLDLVAGEPCDFDAFLQLIQPALGGGCAGCHNAAHRMPFSATDPLKNHSLLDNLAVPFAQRIFELNGTKHGGGNQRSVLPEANVQEWQSVRGRCSQ